MKYFRGCGTASSDKAESSSTKPGRSKEVRRDKAERRLLRELARKNEEVARQREQLGKLHNEVSKIAELQAIQKKHLKSLEKDHKTEVRDLQKQVDEERAVKHSIEVCFFSNIINGSQMELTTLMDRCNELVHESRLREEGGGDEENEDEHAHCHHHEEEHSANNFSERLLDNANEGYTDEHSIQETHETPPAELRKLKKRMKELDETMREEVSLEGGEEEEKQKLERYEASTSKACSHVKKDLGKLKSWVAWKWRWAAEALRSDIMSKRLEGAESDTQGPTSSEGVKTKCFECKKKNCVCPDSKKGGGIVPAVMTAWRAYARAVRLEKKALTMITSLERMVSALPWWIRRVGQRRLLERCFFRWEMAALRRNKSPVQDGSADKVTTKCCACKHDLESKSSKKKPVENAAKKEPIKQRKAWGSSSVKKDYIAWESHVRNKEHTRFSSVKKLQALQAAIQKEVRELESQLSAHMQALEDKNQSYTPKGPIWKGSSNSTWEICNNLVRSLEDARKQLGSADGKLKEGLLKPRKKLYGGGKEQLLDIPGGFQQHKMIKEKESNARQATSKALTNSKHQTRQQQAEPHTVVEVPEACNLTLDPGASVNVTCGDNGTGAGGRADWDLYGGRICSAAQYAEYLRDEIKRLKQWQTEHESDIRKELGETENGKQSFATGDVHPELEVCW